MVYKDKYTYRKLKPLKSREESRNTRWRWLEALGAAVQVALSGPVARGRVCLGSGRRGLCPTSVWAEAGLWLESSLPVIAVLKNPVTWTSLDFSSPSPDGPQFVSPCKQTWLGTPRGCSHTLQLRTGRGKGPPWPPGTGMLSSPLRSPRGSWQMLVRWTPKRACFPQSSPARMLSL